MSDSPLGLVIPTRWETAEIFRRFAFKRLGPSLFESTIHDHRVLLCVSGVGNALAVRAAGLLVRSGAKTLVSAGFCGALVPNLKVGDLVTHRMISVDKPALTSDDRRQLTERANAVAVDMETQAVIEEGTRRGVPIYVLRVVSDAFADDLTPLFGKSGTFSPWKMALRLLNPTVWPLAMKLKKQSAIASVKLAEALDEFCRS